MTTTTNLTVKRKTDVTYSGTVTDEDGTAVNITSATIYFTVKKNKSDSDSEALIQNSGSVTDGASGTYTITLTDDNTDLDIGVYYYDVRFILSSGKTYIGVEGNFTVQNVITQTVS